MKIKVTLVTHYYSTHGGGVEKVAAELAKHLAGSHLLDITWIASHEDNLSSGFSGVVRLVPVSAWNGIERILGVPWPLWSIAALRKLWDSIGTADAAHLHDALYCGSLFAWLFALLRGTPVIVTQHIGHVPYRSSLLRIIHVLANRTLGRLVLSNAERVVFISPAVMEEFGRFCRFKSPAVYWPNGVDTEIFNPGGEFASEPVIAARREAGKHVFLFAGRFVEKKGLNILHELAQAFPEDLWVFAGHGPIDPSHWGLPNVIVVRGVSGPELARYYRAADLLVLPSVGEGFPLVVQEAMACGTPAMVGEETAEGCPDARAFLYVEKVGSDDTVRLWTRRLAEIVADPDQLQSMGLSASAYAQANWSWERVAERYAGLLESVVMKRKSSSPVMGRK